MNVRQPRVRPILPRMDEGPKRGMENDVPTGRPSASMQASRRKLAARIAALTPAERVLLALALGRRARALASKPSNRSGTDVPGTD